VLGSPGLGKSRLLAEFGRRVAERATVLYARCDAAGGATFAPIAEALRAFLRIDEGAGGDVLRAAIDSVATAEDAERARIAAGIGALLAGTPAAPEETFFVVRRLLAAFAAVRPVVLVIDDLHWASRSCSISSSISSSGARASRCSSSARGRPSCARRARRWR
jgi:predicted ATPase